MIDLFIAASTGERLHVKDLILIFGETSLAGCGGSIVSKDAVLLARDPDPIDHRRGHIGLTS